METINEIFGLHTNQLTTLQMCVRACTVFFTAIFYIRVAGIRALGNQNVFENLTKLILGAILGRGIVSAQQPFFPSLIAVLVIVLLHRLLAWATFKNKFLGAVFKGNAIPLYRHGQMGEQQLKQTLTTQEDIIEAMHTAGNVDELNKVESIYLERSGHISIVKKES